MPGWRPRCSRGTAAPPPRPPAPPRCRAPRGTPRPAAAPSCRRAGGMLENQVDGGAYETRLPPAPWLGSGMPACHLHHHPRAHPPPIGTPPPRTHTHSPHGPPVVPVDVRIRHQLEPQHDCGHGERKAGQQLGAGVQDDGAGGQQRGAGVEQVEQEHQVLCGARGRWGKGRAQVVGTGGTAHAQTDGAACGSSWGMAGVLSATQTQG